MSHIFQRLFVLNIETKFHRQYFSYVVNLYFSLLILKKVIVSMNVFFNFRINRGFGGWKRIMQIDVFNGISYSPKPSLSYYEAIR